MNIPNFKLLPDWDEDNVLHIARHNLSPEQVEEVYYGGGLQILRGRGVQLDRSGSNWAEWIRSPDKIGGSGERLPQILLSDPRRDREVYEDWRVGGEQGIARKIQEDQGIYVKNETI